LRARLCALVKPDLKVDSASLVEGMLDPTVKLGTSTPKADPSGDYAFEVFRKADAISPGAQAALERIRRCNLRAALAAQSLHQGALYMDGTSRRGTLIFS
jgi:ABC-type molybdate transport system substrate-binding protein